MVTETQQQPSTCWLVTGANRGIGLEYVQQLLSDKTNRVAAGFRSHGGDLEALQQEAQDRLLLVKIDVSDENNSKARLACSAVPVWPGAVRPLHSSIVCTGCCYGDRESLW